ncbi:MAG: class II glutamine amidotransferase [Lautropia sp.]
MCRWIAYTGVPVRLEEVVTKPARSLVHQSLHAAQCKTATNGDGFGIGWYGDREMPGVYREIAPAWSDQNLLSLCAQLKAQTFLAHVRAATVAGTSRDNCHPFSVGPWLFMHNGQIGEFAKVRRRIESMIPDDLYPHRRGGTDSEAIFLIALAAIEHDGPAAAIAQTLARVQDEMSAAGITAPLRFAAALTDGRRLTVFRYASDPVPPSVWYRRTGDATVVVSEPLDDNDAGWQALPANHVLETPCAGQAGALTIRSMEAVSGLAVFAMPTRHAGTDSPRRAPTPRTEPSHEPSHEPAQARRHAQPIADPVS